MCVLCGEFVGQVHWTDRHIEDKARSSESDVEDYQRFRQRDRLHRAKLANEVLRHYGLRLEDWNRSRYLLKDGKGRSELVHDLGAMWPVASKLAGRTTDPLDPGLQEVLRSVGEAGRG